MGARFAIAQQPPSGVPTTEQLEQELESKTAAQHEEEQRKEEQRKKAKQDRDAQRKADAILSDARAAAAARPLTCNAPGKALTAITFNGPLSYSTTSLAAAAAASWTLTWNINNTGSSGYSGSLRADVFAYSDNFDPNSNSLSAYFISSNFPNINGEGAYSSNQLKAGYSVSSITTTQLATNPPIGKYCIVVFLKEYSNTCTAADHYCWDSWTQFPVPALFQ
jgi:hypothetical protein